MAREVKPLSHPFTSRFAAVFIIFFACTGAIFAQETATSFFAEVSENYESIRDYTADLVITRGDTVQTAKVWYKSPNLLRLDFVEPEGMVMVVDGELLQVWVPDYSVTFSQPLRRDSQAQLASLTGSSGLELIKKYYTISYDPIPQEVPLDPGSSENVVKLKAEWKSNNEGFRKLELSIMSIGNYKYIRRVKGITTTNEEITFDFTNMVVNPDIPYTRFEYESPPTGNTIENFLFDTES
ncbi:MAG: outer membrane lipoprotein carrier protein LolA [Spirochaetaceae bacterium]|nr:outer membrane lipoprotein carrier protein LolA [Spirochaetaceae bacterium]